MGLYNPSQITASPVISSNCTPSSVSSAITSSTLLSANINRKGATIWNNSTANLYIEFGATALTTSFLAKLAPNGYYEVPFYYAGIISGIWDVVDGNALVRELT